MRSARALVVAVALGVLLAIPAAAKQGVRAKLDRPVRLATAPGKTLSVAWHLVDGRGRPFGASGIYLRVSRCGHGPLRVRAKPRGHGGYSARVKVPSGGIRKLTVGLKGVMIVGGHSTRADVFFQFDPPVRRDCS
jgi:hypothetical protein